MYKTKAIHHTAVLSEAVKTNNLSWGLRSNINPRVPNPKDIDFVVEWQEVTQHTILSYMKIILKYLENRKEDTKMKIEMMYMKLTYQGEWEQTNEILQTVEETQSTIWREENSNEN